mmetsp:Transcript_1234/g.3793  ORF Transcript_1234/g.3793 Transcript_1234/m.3793 type:complete len:163 (-) Transcript_1234:304-792(-)
MSLSITRKVALLSPRVANNHLLFLNRKMYPLRLDLVLRYVCATPPRVIAVLRSTNRSHVQHKHISVDVRNGINFTKLCNATHFVCEQTHRTSDRAVLPDIVHHQTSNSGIWKPLIASLHGQPLVVGTYNQLPSTSPADITCAEKNTAHRYGQNKAPDSRLIC